MAEIVRMLRNVSPPIYPTDLGIKDPWGIRIGAVQPGMSLQAPRFGEALRKSDWGAAGR